MSELMAALLGALVAGGIYEFVLVPRLWRIFERTIAQHTEECAARMDAAHARVMAHLTGRKPSE